MSKKDNKAPAPPAADPKTSEPVEMEKTPAPAADPAPQPTQALAVAPRAAIAELPDEMDIDALIARQMGTVERPTLPRIKMPGSGAKVFDPGDLDLRMGANNKTFQAIIMEVQPGKAWWEVPMDEGGTKYPQCYSLDGVNGIATDAEGGRCPSPTGKCADCPMGQFGSKNGEGSGKACKDGRMIFMLAKPEDAVPFCFRIPGTSIRNIEDYTTLMSQQKTPLFFHYTEFGLEGAKSKGGIDYSKLTLKRGPKLEDAEIKTVFRTFKKILPMIAALSRKDLLEREEHTGPAGEVRADI